jgi:hypothetical protein
MWRIMGLFKVATIGRRGLALAVLCPLLAGSAFAQESVTPSQTMTSGFLNGRGWNNWTRDFKIGFTMGLNEGYVVGLMKAEKAVGITPDAVKSIDAIGDQITMAISIGEIMKQIDNFYGDPQNLEIPINNAYVVIARKVKGEKDDSIQALIVSLRKEFSKDAAAK